MRALIFDFDGLILDTESTDFESWRAVYAAFGVELPRDQWVDAIGTDGAGLDPGAALSEATGLPALELRRRRREIRDVLVARLAPRSGVREWLAEAERLGLPVGIASSSPRWWVEGHLNRVGLRSCFAILATADDVDRVKPDPAVYRAALKRLSVAPPEAVAIEDSPNGLRAASAAGLRCIAVPGPMTAGLGFDGATLVLESLSDRTLADVLDEIRSAV